MNRMLDKVENIFPRNLKFAWMVKPREKGSNVVELLALKVSTRDGSAPLTGEVITDARQDYDPNGNVEISMNMNSEGARVWKRLTGDNIGRQIAIVLDGYVYSAPTLMMKSPAGGHRFQETSPLRKLKTLPIFWRQVSCQPRPTLCRKKL
ncbi:MAG: hypothetical protein U5L09_19620 [Bacteroidales bacterium]|nr:hypothetical protein [Bacteroidales bacterium]